jgi:hypothetical protein
MQQITLTTLTQTFFHTMTTVKNFFSLLLLAAAATVFTPSAALAQAKPDDNEGIKKEFPIKAKEAREEVMLLLPAVQKVREAAARNLAATLVKASALCTRIEKAGSQMSNAQLAGFQREIAVLDAELDRARLAHATPNAAGKLVFECECGPKAGLPAWTCTFKCFKIKYSVGDTNP